jgi:hypothetical protein
MAVVVRQDVEKCCQLCSHFTQGLDVPQGSPRPSLAPAALGGLFEHPAGHTERIRVKSVLVRLLACLFLGGASQFVKEELSLMQRGLTLAC